MSTNYADRLQGIELDDRLAGVTKNTESFDWFDYSPNELDERSRQGEEKRLAALPDRLRIAMGQMEAVLAKQGGSV